MKTINRLFTALSLAFLLVFCSASLCGAEEIQTQQYQALKSNNTALVLKLETLEIALNNLKTPSTELAAQLAECRADLKQANELLIVTQEKLSVSQKSLASAEALQKKTELSLIALEREIATLKNKSKKGWQVAKILGIILLIKCIHDKKVA